MASAGARSALRWAPCRPGCARPWCFGTGSTLSVGETAELMNCSEGTVKSQTAKAAARLRDLLSPAAVERTHP